MWRGREAERKEKGGKKTQVLQREVRALLWDGEVAVADLEHACVVEVARAAFGAQWLFAGWPLVETGI